MIWYNRGRRHLVRLPAALVFPAPQSASRANRSASRSAQAFNPKVNNARLGHPLLCAPESSRTNGSVVNAAALIQLCHSCSLSI